MGRYLVRRLLWMIVVIFGVSIVVFGLIHITPGDPAQIMLGHRQANVTQVYAERDLAKGVEVARRIG